MCSVEQIFSLRLVIADFYMEKPVPGLDTCYSEFRGKEIKRVPVIRIFGSNAEGQKTCMHVHGVFPYFYIPYDQKDFQSLNQAIYQVALNLDKAINISLSQSSSSAQHVFKVQLVKGIPFYGYHRSDHQYLKIYMFNPRFVRRAANLLQNGAILNKNFHPHESHVPYILQFMIDYNLYGMSFLHVPSEIVKFRRSTTSDEIPYKHHQESQILNISVAKKISCSALEIDIGSNFILNRFQLIAKTNAAHKNPGVESIWNDERLRRQKLVELDGDQDLNMIPPLEVPSTQERPNVQPTDSELFHRTALLSKLLTETSTCESTEISNQSTTPSNISSTTCNLNNLSLNKQQKRTFNLSKILQNFVYPEECSQNDNIINASFIPNHLSGNNIFEQSFVSSSNEIKDRKEQNEVLNDNVFMEETIVDEELVLSLTQSQHLNMDQQNPYIPLNATLRNEDMELLDILQELEEDNEDKIDLDSSLAPLSQNHKNFILTPNQLDKETTAAALQESIAEIDSEDNVESDENIHDFSIALENLDDLILKLTQSQTEPSSPNNNLHESMPQVDGANDLLKTPTKTVKNSRAKPLPRTPTTPKNRRLTKGSPSHSPKTPKTSRKYAALPLVSVNRSANKSLNVSNSNEVSPFRRTTVDRNSLPLLSLRKNLALSDLRRKSISVDTDLEEHITALKERTRRRHSNKLVDLDKTHITCALTPRKTNKNMLKVYRVECSDKKILESNEDFSKEFKGSINRQKKPKASKSLRSFETKTTEISTTVKNSQKDQHYIHNDSNQQPEYNRTLGKTNFIRQNAKGNSGLKKSESLKNSISEKDKEIVDTDSNADNRPSCSFIARNTTKRRKITKKSTATNSIPLEKLNPYKFNCKIEGKLNKNNFKLKKCKVHLKRIRNDMREEITAGKIKYEGCIIESGLEKLTEQKRKSKNSTEEMQTKNVVCNKIARVANVLKSLAKTTHSMEENVSSTAVVANSEFSSKKMPIRKDRREQETILQNLESLQKALSSKSQNFATANENSVQALSLDMNRESSDEEITETPPQESDKSLRFTHLYNKSITLHSPLLFTQNSSPIFLTNTELKGSKTPSTSHSTQEESVVTLTSSSNYDDMMPEAKIVLTPLDLPPSREDVLKGCLKLQLPQHEFQQPFYSNPDDITKHKELGFTILRIPGNKLNDVEEFESVLGTDLKGLTAWRRGQLIELGGIEMLNKYRNTQAVRQYFSTRKSIIMAPQFNPPTRQEAKLWLKAKELLRNQGDDLQELKIKNLEEDSPIKIRRQKVTMMYTESGNASGDDNHNLDCSSRSLTLTPLTPATPVPKESKIKENLKLKFTPVTRNIEKRILKRDMSFTKRNNCRVLRRVSLNKQLKEAFEKESKQSCQEITTIKNPKTEHTSQSLLISQDSEISVTSEMALAELERSSFVRHLKEPDITLAGLTDNSSLNNSFGFKVALENLQQAKADVELNYLTILVLEVFVATRDDLYPNPELDEIRCLFYAIENSVPNDLGQNLPRKACGYIMVHDYRDIVAEEGRIHGIDVDIEVTIVQTEVEALEALLNLCSRWDPDIYAGYEIEMSSWGFVMERAKYLCLNIAPLLSRIPTQKMRDFVDEDRESFTDLDVEMKLCGRILLDVWRLLRSEIALTSYTFESVMYHIMHKRCPWHSYRSLSEWFASPCSRWIVIEYYLERVRGTLSLLDQLDLIGRTSEMAKLIGIQFYEVLSRGSQFRVESMMLRIAKPKNLVPLSPSVQQRAHMRAPEYLALIMEPQSRFYADPVIVLDFQSLYPSMIIAYNYCFSTCLGRVEHLGQFTPFEFGASQLRVSPAMLRKLIERDLVTISPCGVVFVKSSVREGILPRMLTEILDTRQMVKQSMKLHKSNSALQRILHSRQLGLKLMANVTYGYTAANFSGRMPCVEVGDSVVSKGRETLEQAIKMVEANDKWNVKVVYGDTDSMFVLVPGRNREAAFRIGEEIAEAVTKQNPHPVKLKLEKVYQPCILQTKKRYVGYMYESPDQNEPVYEAKGIETVRRDGCPIVAKMLEKVLRILFESADVTQVKQFVCRQFTKILSGRANLQDLIFAKEFRGLNGYRPTACVPALELTRKWIQTDPRRIPRRGERVPFIITNGAPGVPLIRLVRHPHEVLANEGFKINAIYYITKAIIPPLNRCLLLIGADVNEWFANLPRKLLLTPALSTANEIIPCPNGNQFRKSTISQFFSTTNCIVDCGRQTKQGICSDCSQNSSRAVVILQTKISKIERSYHTTQQICQACCGRIGDLQCGSLDCPVLYVLEAKRRDLQQIMHFRKLVEDRF